MAETNQNDFQDQIRYCENCGISFLVSQEEQAQRDGESPIPLPQRCPGCRKLAPGQDRERGLVKWFNRRRRYGFVIRRDDDEIFAHGSDIANQRSLRPGDLVEFNVEQGERGPVAKAIQVIDHTDESINS